MKDKATKRQEAEARNQAYQALSLDEKIERAKSAPGQSKKQLAKLEAQKR